jgi:triphosphoribosyl-dephospho-CoA synthase
MLCAEAALPLANPSLAIGDLATRALVLEVELTPKPGLVDRANSGAHRDMDLGTFRAAIAAIAPWWEAFHRLGDRTRTLPADEILPLLRPLGLACEQDMLEATGGVNTHKGGIFALGLACAAAGRLGPAPGREALCREVGLLCRGLVEKEFPLGHPPRTEGGRLFHAYGFTGARGEAASGFATVRRFGLPALREAREAGLPEEAALLQTLLHLMAHNADTNLVRRGGLDALARVQDRSRALLGAGGLEAPGAISALEAFDLDLIRLHLSPGGSADLLALTWFLAELP